MPEQLQLTAAAGEVANVPLTAAFRNCSCQYCSSGDLNVLYKSASFREPKVPSFTVTDELEAAWM